MFFPYRDDNPRRRIPIVTLLLIGVNIAVHVYQMLMTPERRMIFIRAAGAIPIELRMLTDIVLFPDDPQAVVPIPLTAITSIFVHGSWLHLISNLWYLWLFGDNVEDRFGHFRFLVFYLVAGLFATTVQIAVDPMSQIPIVGASGAIAGALGSYALLFPAARIHCFVFLIFFFYRVRIPAIVVLGFWFILQLMNGIAAPSVAGVAWFAHIGGFLFGVLLTRLFIKYRE